MFNLVNDFRKKKYWGWTTDNRESTGRRKVQIVIDLKDRDTAWFRYRVTQEASWN